MHDDDVTALHVHDPGPLRPVALPIETLKRTARLEHRVEVTDEQQPRPTSVSASDEVTRAIPRRTVDPLRLEPQSVELLAEEHAHLAHSVEVHGAAVDVHRPLEQVDGFGGPRVDFARDPPFDFRQRLTPQGKGGQRCRQQKRDSDRFHAISIQRGPYLEDGGTMPFRRM